MNMSVGLSVCLSSYFANADMITRNYHCSDAANIRFSEHE